MAEIVPGILAKDFDEVKKKIEQVEPYVTWVQLDVADGDFAPAVSWGDPVALHDYDPGVFIEAHLMIQEPENVLDDWIASGVKRIYFHHEATAQPGGLIRKIREADLEVGVALLPDTPLSAIALYDELLDAVLLFSGNLGFYGGEFQEEITLEKISTLRQAHPELTIEVDGGMNPENAQKVAEAGANLIVSGGYIFNSSDPSVAIKELQNAVRG